MQLFGTRTIAIICVVGSVISLLLSISAGSPLFAFLCALLLSFSLIIWKYGYAIMPSIFLGLKIKEEIGDFRIPPSQDLIIKKTTTGYIATAYLGVSLEEGGANHPASFERAISLVKFPCKFSILIYTPDLSTYLDELKTKRSMVENKKSQLLSDSKNHPQAVRIEREIAMWTRQLERLSSGEKPVQILSFASTSAFGDSAEEAQTKLRAQIRELKSMLANSLLAQVSELKGEEMKKCFDWEYAIPDSKGAILEEVD